MNWTKIALVTGLTITGTLSLNITKGNALVLTTFQDAMQPNTPASGWSYLWNNSGAVGNPANYTALLPGNPTHYYTVNGNGPFPSSGPGGYALFAKDPITNIAGGHPGRGINDSQSGGIERYVIAAYTLSTSGTISIDEGLLTNVDTSTGGLDLGIYVNNNSTPLFTTSTAGGLNSNASFSNINLGNLNVGDTIYVAIGARNIDFDDSFSLQYSIDATTTTVPEPLTILGSMTALGLGLTLKRKLK